MSQYRDEARAVAQDDDDCLVWSTSDAWADSMLEQWGRWARSDHEGIGYPKSQPFAIKSGGGLPVCEDTAYKVDAALRRMDAGWRAVLKTKYYARGYIGPRVHLKAMREFVNAFAEV